MMDGIQRESIIGKVEIIPNDREPTKAPGRRDCKNSGTDFIVCQNMIKEFCSIE